MNTLLLSTNTANCTTKNLKKIAAVICMTAVFVLTGVSVFAQNETPVSIPVTGKIMTIEEGNKAKQSSVNVTSASVTPAETKTVAPAKEAKAQDPSSLPYYNYKGIANLEEAKKLWVSENPDAYKGLQTNTGVSQQNYPAVKPATNNGVSPNAHRRLPANYDDSKLGNPQTK